VIAVFATESILMRVRSSWVNNMKAWEMTRTGNNVKAHGSSIAMGTSVPIEIRNITAWSGP
jgi:hypothetical protein